MNQVTQAGYTANVIDFGWTNGVFVTLLDELSGKPASIEKRNCQPLQVYVLPRRVGVQWCAPTRGGLHG